MTTEKDLGRLEADMENLKANHAGLEGKMEERLTKIEGYLQEIRDAANMGKGMFWLLLKIGAVLAALASAGVWIWDKISHVGGPR